MAKIRFVTPQGRAKYPWLNKPDTQFSADGVYSTYLIMDAGQAADFKQLVKDTGLNAFGAKAKYSVPVETDEETGDFVAKFKSKYVPTFIDSAGEVIDPEVVPSIFGGSVLSVAGEVYPYAVSGKKGISLRLNLVQVIDPVSGGEGAGNPFGVVEGGFVKADAPAPAPATNAQPSTDDDDDDFDF